MSKLDRQRLIIELIVTGICAPLAMLLWFFLSPRIFSLGRAIAGLIEKLVHAEHGGWFEGLGPTLVVDFFLTWIAFWIVLFVTLKMIQRFTNRKKREA